MKKSTESTSQHGLKNTHLPVLSVLWNIHLVFLPVLAISCSPKRDQDHATEVIPQADTTWPVLINRLADLDTTRVVQLDSGLVFRTDITLSFKAGISDSAKRAFFARHSMTVVGVTQSGKFFVRIPDPGPQVQNLWDALDALRIEPEVDIVTFISWTAMREVHF
jgi:hypothetical protein